MKVKVRDNEFRIVINDLILAFLSSILVTYKI